jgi:hypothetical protein
MNSKLQELIKQATERVEVGPEGLAGPYYEDELNAEKLVELVVNECLNVIHTNKRCPDGWIGSHEAGFQFGCNKSIENIKDHFGIK